MANCDKCTRRKGTVSGVMRGVYYKNLCKFCLTGGQEVSSGQASFNRQRDLEDHAQDMVQPFVGGRANSDFIRLYPDSAKNLFTKDEIADAFRK